MLCELHVNFISKHLVKTCCEQKNIVKFIIFSVHIDAWRYTDKKLPTIFFTKTRGENMSIPSVAVISLITPNFEIFAFSSL